MTRACLNCGADMDCKRQSKKYCNDTCKQLAYIKRNGLQSNVLNLIPVNKTDSLASNNNTRIEDKNEVEELLNEISIRVLKLLELKKKASQQNNDGLCMPSTFKIQKM